MAGAGAPGRLGLAPFRSFEVAALSHAPIPRFTAVAPLRAEVSGWRRAGERVVLVPTMGALHAGHLALMARAKEVGQRVVASIFVNPTQFGPNEDFSRYPRDTETDLSLLAQAGVDAAYLPEVSGMYPEHFSTRIEVDGLTEGLCGAYRPGHFSGVATVVTKLLNQVQPDIALFGEKDFQQLLVIRRAVRDLDLPVEIQGVPTLREVDGLALSSRNRYLDADERARAPHLQAVLARIGEGLAAGGHAGPLLAEGRAALKAAGFDPVQYLEIRDAETLAPVERATRPVRVLAAAYLGRTRLIDNVPANPAGLA
jgi:pantoate--beta-alanine ligase